MQGFRKAKINPHTPDLLSSCTACGRFKDRVKVVFPSGHIFSALAFVFSQPGPQEDKTGNVYSSPLMDKLFYHLGGNYRNYYVTYAVKCGPKPVRIEEAKECFGWLEAEMVCVNPRLIVAVGKTAFEILVPDKVDLRISLLDPLPPEKCVFPATSSVNLKGYSVFPMFHPSACELDDHRRKSFGIQGAKLKYLFEKYIQ